MLISFSFATVAFCIVFVAVVECISTEEVSAHSLRVQSLENAGLASASSSRTWPSPESWHQLLKNVTSRSQKDPCSAPLLARARLRPQGLGCRLNDFVDELLDAIVTNSAVSLCAPSDVRDTWAVYFQDVGFARCGSCDWSWFSEKKAFQAGWALSLAEENRSHVQDLKRFLYRSVFRLKADMQAKIDKQASSLGISTGDKFLGVHIRRGDKAKEDASVPIDEYAAAIKRLGSELGISKVFLASDSADTYASLKDLLGPLFVIFEQPRLPAEAYSLRGDIARQWSSERRLRAVEASELNLLVDVSLLVRADAFIGTASSNIGRLAFFLRDPEKGPVLSLDEGGDFLKLPGF